MYIGYDSTGTTSAHLRFYANGQNERMRIDASSGNVGIGTTSPTQLLSVNGSAILIGTATSSVTLGFGTANGVSGWSIGNGIIDNTHNFRIYDNTAGQNRLTLDGSGNLGIGTTSPLSKLDITDTSRAYNGELGSFRIADSANTNKRLFLGFDSTVGAGYIQSIFGGTSYLPTLINPVSGNVGIGNTNPAYKLDVSGTGNFTGALTGTSASFSGLNQFLDNTVATTSGKWMRMTSTGSDFIFGINNSTGVSPFGVGGNYSTVIGTNNATDLVLLTNGVVRQTISSTGAATFSSSVTANELIGLKTSGQVNVIARLSSNDFYMYNNSSEYGLYSNDYGSLFVRNKSTGLLNIYDKAYLTSAGNLILGSSVDAGFKFDVNGTGRFSGNLTVDTNTLFVNATNDRVGVGTITPSYTFDVNKTVAADFVARIANTSSTGYGLYVQANDNTKAGIRIANASGGTAIDLFGSGAATFSSTIITGGTTANASAQLQADSTTKGFLPPRMTAAQRTAIGTPAAGLIVYQTDSVEGLYIYSGASWKSLTMV